MKTIIKIIVFYSITAVLIFTQGERVLAKDVKLYVDAVVNQAGDGTKNAPFKRITDAVNQARAMWQADNTAKIEIRVESGKYVGTYSNTDPNKEDLPITLDIPNLKLKGSTSMLSDGDGLPTGEFEPGKNSVIIAEPKLAPELPLLVLTGQSVEVSQFSFNFGHIAASGGGTCILVEKVQDYVIRSNYMTGGGLAGIEARASSGKIQGNYMTSLTYGALIGMGNASSPAHVVFSGNRAVSNSSGGLFLGGDVTGSGFDRLSAAVDGNDLSRNNTNLNQGAGIRFIVLKHDPPDLATSGNITASISNNKISENNFGYLIDAGFPYRIFPNTNTPDPRLHNGTLDLSFQGNEVVGNRRAPALISFTRNTATLTPNSSTNGLSRFKYLEHSTYNITDPGGEFTGFWFDHPVSDPVDGRILQNVLKINGVEILNGRFVP